VFSSGCCCASKKLIAVTCLGVLLTVHNANGQSAPRDPSIVDRPRLRVDVSDFRQTGQASTIADYAEFFRSLAILQLKGLRGIAIDKSGQGRQCLSNISSRQAVQLALAALPLTDRLPIVAVSAVVTPDSNRTLIEIEVTGCHGDTVARIMHSSNEVQGSEPLPQLLVLVGSIARAVDEQIPRATVAIRSGSDTNGGDTLAQYFSSDVADRISQRLENQNDLRVTDSGVQSTVDYAFTTSTRRISPDIIEGRSLLRIRGEANPVDSLVLRGSLSNRDKFADALADSTVARFFRGRQFGYTRVVPPVEVLSDAALEARARSALCLTKRADCQSNATVAIAALDSAIARRPSAARYLLIGRAYRLRGDDAKAIASFRQALKARDSTATEAEILTALASALRETGSNTAAIGPYGRLVELYPMDSVLARESALNLRLASQRLASLRAFARLARAYPDWSQPVDDFDAGLRGLNATEAADSAGIIANICLSAESLVGKCYKAMAAQAEIIAGGTDSRGRLRRIATALIQMADGFANRIAESNAYLSRSILGPTSLAYEAPGTVTLRRESTGGFDSALTYIDIAGVNADRAGDSALREWVLRLRAQFALMKGDADAAYTFAMQGASLHPSIYAKRLVASAALLTSDKRLKLFPNQRRIVVSDSLITPLLAEGDPQTYLIFIQLRHRLGQDLAARDTLQRMYKASPNNTLARWALGMVCSEFLKDRQCAFRTWNDAFLNGLVKTYGDTLNAVEAALGADSVETAAKWLGPALLRPTDVCRKVVAYIFAYWIASARKDEVTRSDAQKRWNQALATARAGPGPHCWIFEGGKALMTGREASALSPARRAELLAMMREVDPD